MQNVMRIERRDVLLGFDAIARGSQMTMDTWLCFLGCPRVVEPSTYLRTFCPDMQIDLFTLVSH